MNFGSIWSILETFSDGEPDKFKFVVMSVERGAAGVDVRLDDRPRERERDRDRSRSRSRSRSPRRRRGRSESSEDDSRGGGGNDGDRHRRRISRRRSRSSSSGYSHEPQLTREELEILDLTRDARTVFVSQLLVRTTEDDVCDFFEQVSGVGDKDGDKAHKARPTHASAVEALHRTRLPRGDNKSRAALRALLSALHGRPSRVRCRPRRTRGPTCNGPSAHLRP